MKTINYIQLNSAFYVLIFFLLVQLQTHPVLASSSSLEPNNVVAKPGCKDKCGNLTIPYPFGIGEGCYFDKDFEIMCDEPALGPTWTGEPIYYISIDDHSFSTTSNVFPVIFDKSGKGNADSFPMLAGNSYFNPSPIGNKLVVIGCDIYGYIKDGDTGEITGGCAAFCDSRSANNHNSSSACTGNNGCCESAISRIPKNITLSIQTMNTVKSSWATKCSYIAFAHSGYSKRVSQLLSTNSSKCADTPPPFSEVMVEWVISNMHCQQAIRSPKYACGKNSNCFNSPNGSGYRCRCSPGYRGNPYLSTGCQDIDECASPNLSHCPHNTHCVNAHGSFYCEPNNGRSIPILQLCLGITAPVIFIFLVAGCFLLHRQIKRRKEEKAKQKYFKRNGGLLLQNQISVSEGSGSTNLLHMKLFKREELEKATDNFNESRILGKGGLGTVYKGMLSDGSIVAIKKSNAVDEDQVGQFVNEIFILSQINYRHIVKVLGCCLETQVPLLVYEYISNGTLSQHLHGNSRPVTSHDSRNTPITLSLEDRLRIAREIAGALSYLHSYASSAIFHRDIKSSNILLDENYRAVVSDFGLSRLVPLEKTHLTTKVGGTFGYLDPEYFHSGHLNDKSDVYAFGVVLLELLTSQRAISSDESSGSQSLALRFKSMFKQSRLLEMVDPKVARDVEGQEVVPIVAKLAKRCLKSKARNRPSMKEVAAELEELRIMARYDMPHAAGSFQENISVKSESLCSYTSDNLIEDNYSQSLSYFK